MHIYLSYEVFHKEFFFVEIIKIQHHIFSKWITIMIQNIYFHLVKEKPNKKERSQSIISQQILGLLFILKNISFKN